MGVKLGHAKFQRSTPKGTFLNWGLNEGGRKSLLLMENWPYLGNGDRCGQCYH